MGERGRQPDTAALNKLKGNPSKRKPKKPVKVSELIMKLPAAPKHIQKTAGSEWRRVGDDLIQQGKLNVLNLKALELYCYNYGFVREQMATLEKDDAVVSTGKGGHKMPHPAIAIMNKAQVEMRYWLKFIGLSEPVATEKKDELSEFFKRGGKLGVVKK